MPKEIILLFLILLLPKALGFCQDVTHYEEVLLNTKNKNLQLVAMDSILKLTFKTDPDVFILYSLKYIGLAQEIGKVEQAAKKAMNLQYPLTKYKNDPLQAITIINSVLARKYKIKDSLLLGRSYIKRGSVHTKIDLKKAIED